MPFTLPPNPAENTVVNVTAERKLIFKNGRWRQYINNTVQETVGIPYGSLINVPSEFTPSPHNHEYADLTGVPSKFNPTEHRHSYSDLDNLPASYPPADHTHSFSSLTGVIPAHKHERITSCPFPGKFIAGPGVNRWFPSRNVTLKGIYLTMPEVATEDIAIDLVINSNDIVFTTKPTLTMGSLRSTRIDFERPMTPEDSASVNIVSGAGSNLTVVLIYEDAV